MMWDMSLAVRRHASVDEFLAAAGGFLAGHEAEHNLMLGICGQIRATPELFGEPPRFMTVTDGDRMAGATLRTPPSNQVLSEMDEATVDVVADALAGEALPGVVGPKEAAARFVERWAAASGVPARLSVSERIFRLDRVVAPPSTSGTWRPAAPGDRELVAAWIVAFLAEAIPDEPPLAEPLATADRWIEGRYRRLYLWEEGGRPVSVVGIGGETPSGVRIGPVYTPPEHRGRGYASNLTAVVSQLALDEGRQFCFLFTDLANPTSNRIYQAIGYRPVRDVDMYRFEPDA